MPVIGGGVALDAQLTDQAVVQERRQFRDG